MDNAEIYHNTIYGTNDLAGGTGYRSMVSISGVNANLKFYNNIIHGTVDRSNYLCRRIPCLSILPTMISDCNREVRPSMRVS